MSDFDFLKEFGKDLDRERPHEPADKDWEKLAASLDTQDRGKRRRRLILLWAFPVAASVMMAVMGAMLWRTSAQADRLQTEVTRLQMERDVKDEVVLADTLMQTVTVIRYDTIYRTVVVKSSIAEDKSVFVFNRSDKEFHATSRKSESQLSRTKELHQDSLEEKNALARSTRNENPVNRQKANSIVPVEEIHAQMDSLASHNTKYAPVADISVRDRIAGDSIMENKDLLPLPSKIITTPKSLQKRRLPDVFNMAIAIPAPTLPRPSLIRHFQPHQFMVGLTGGMLFPQTEHATPRNNYTLGINGQVVFGSHLRLFAGLERGWTNFKIEGDALDNFHIPLPPPPPSPDDILNYAEVKQPLWDFSLGLRYVFLPEKRLRPFVSAAWLAEHTQEQTLKYEFLNLITEEESYTLVPHNNAEFNHGGLQFGAGIEWAFTGRWMLGLEGIYQRQYETSVPLLAERWGMKLGVTRTF